MPNMAQHAHRVVGVVAVFPILIGRERGSQYADRRPAEFAHGAHTIADRRQFCRNNVRAIKRKARREGRADRKYGIGTDNSSGYAEILGIVCIKLTSAENGDVVGCAGGSFAQGPPKEAASVAPIGAASLTLATRN